MLQIRRFLFFPLGLFLVNCGLDAQELRDVNVETIPVSEKEKSPLDNPILWKNIRRVGPTVGIPLPWNLSDGDTIALRRVKVEGKLRVSEAEVKIVLSMHNRSDKERKVKMAMPVNYEAGISSLAEMSRDMWTQGVSIVMDGQRENLVERKRIIATRVAVDGKEINYEYGHGTHPQCEAPSMGLMKDIRDWAIFNVDFKGNQELLVEIAVIVPYSQDITITHQKETISPGRLKFITSSARAWYDALHWGIIALDPQEMGQSQVSVANPDGFKLSKKIDGWYEWPVTSEMLSLAEPLSVHVLPEIRMEKGQGDSIQVGVSRGGNGVSYDQYKAIASTTLDGTNAHELKASSGGWAEGVSGDGKGENVEITLEAPQRLLGIIMVSGRNPAFMGEQEQKHPDLTHTFYGRPGKVMITLNDSYSFPVTLRDDWNTQFLIPPHYNKPVKTIKVTMDSVHGGKVSADTWISQILPVRQN